MHEQTNYYNIHHLSYVMTFKHVKSVTDHTLIVESPAAVATTLSTSEKATLQTPRLKDNTKIIDHNKKKYLTGVSMSKISQILWV